MDKADIVAYWMDSAESDYRTMMHLFAAGDYHWALFLGHLVVEKALKALFAQRNGEEVNIPRSHDLLLLADRCGIKTNNNQKDMLDTITTFNISARYPDYKQSFYKKCTKEYTSDKMVEIKEIYIWLKEMLPSAQN